MTVTIAADGTDNLVVSYVTATATVNFTSLPFTNCSVQTNFMEDSLSVSLEASLLFGNELELRQSITSGTTTTTCNVFASKN